MIRSTLLLTTLAVTVTAAVEMQRPAHHTDEGFRNLYIEDPTDKNFFTYMKMKYFSDEVFADHTEDAESMPVVADAIERMSDLSDQPRVTWLGHSTFLIQYQGINILTDPILTNRASPVFFAGPARLVDKPVTLSDIPRIDYVIISHDHYDHLDQYSIEWLGDQPIYLVPLELKDWFELAGISSERVIEFDWWDEESFAGIRFAATPSQHWSGRGLFDRYESLWAAWRIDFEDGFSLWFAGDTGYNDVQFRETHERYGDVDLALIPIGAYAPRWFMKASHVNPEEAVRIHNDVGARLSIGMHWATFQLTAEPYYEPQQLLEEQIRNGKLDQGRFITMAIGESIDIDAFTLKHTTTLK